MIDEKTSKVRTAKFEKEVPLRTGTFYQHWVSFENGDAGEYLSKQQVQIAFVPGQETKYTIEMDGRFTKIKPVSQPNQETKPESNRDRIISRQVAIKAAVELELGSGTPPNLDKIFTTAEKITAWIQQ